MPLFDTPWERGKCAYKLIQYMACGVPVVASPVGANRNVVIDGQTGFFAASDRDWVDRLSQLLSDVELRQRLGKSGRLRVEADFCLQKTAPKLIEVIKQVLD
jgi:glycosyltransferase involved in cell wall biosynthesis